MEYGMAGRYYTSVGECKNLFISDAGTFGYTDGKKIKSEYHKQNQYQVG